MPQVNLLMIGGCLDGQYAVVDDAKQFHEMWRPIKTSWQLPPAPSLNGITRDPIDRSFYRIVRFYKGASNHSVGMLVEEHIPDNEVIDYLIRGYNRCA